MAIVDERGRLFGRWNLLDLALLVLMFGLIPLGYAAYVLFRDQPPRLVSVSPNQVAQAPEFTLTITGENLRPYMRVSAGTQQGREFLFKSTEEAQVPFSALPPGQYDIVLFDQAQERFRLPNALSITPLGLPATQLVVVGAFGNLDAAAAAKLTAGTVLPGVGEVLAVGTPVPDLTDVFAGSKFVPVPIPNALKLPAIVRFNCLVRSQGGTPFCNVEDATMAPPSVVRVTTSEGKIPFQIESVRSPHPLTPVPLEVRLIGEPSVLSLIKAGDVDLGGTTNELALLARVTTAGPVHTLGPTAAEVTVRLIAQLQNVGGRWLYDSGPLRAGSPILLRTTRYQANGVVTGLPPADGAGGARP